MMNLYGHGAAQECIMWLTKLQGMLHSSSVQIDMWFDVSPYQ
jgi:hypothetical protein